MNCPSCNHLNDGGKFCVNCGTEMGTQLVANEPNKYIETSKQISKQYASFFIRVLKKPNEVGKGITQEYFVNGITTAVIYSFIIPLIFYFAMKGFLSNVNEYVEFFGNMERVAPSFKDVVLLPTIAFFIFIALLMGYTFLALKLSKVSVNIQSVVARFGAFLIPIVAILFLALILVIFKMSFAILFFVIAFIGSITIVPVLVMSSFSKNQRQRLDTFYGALLVVVLSFLTIFFMENLLFESIKDAISDYFMI